MADSDEPRNYKSWAEAFTIFAKYDDKPYGEVAAEHDEIYAGPDPQDVSDEDLARLEVLGWHADEETQSFYHFT